jgi:hypothetical protein
MKGSVLLVGTLATAGQPAPAYLPPGRVPAGLSVRFPVAPE